MTTLSADIVICGAGIGGVATAYHLATKHNISNVLLVDPEPPLSVTSDKSAEGYRNWWPGPGDAMVALTNRSVDILEAMHRRQPKLLPMNRGGYVFVSADPTRANEFTALARESCELGAGTLRIHRGNPEDPPYVPASEHGLWDAPDGADLLLDRALIRKHFPHLTTDACIILHARRCGWFAARQFGMQMLEEARAKGVRLYQGEVVGVEIQDGAVCGVCVQTGEGEAFIQTSKFVNAAGPGQKQVGKLLGLDLPVHAELHVKVAIDDHKQIIPRDMPLTLWADPVQLEWTDEERAFLAGDDESRWLLEKLPPIVVGRSEGGAESNFLLMQWEYRIQPEEPIFPFPVDPEFPEYVLRGLARMVPGMKAYFEKLPKPHIDGGYYIRTAENRPIIGPIRSIKGAYMIGALSGAGMQISPAGGELLADHLAGAPLPHYAPAFLLERFDDPDYLELIAEWGNTGNL